MDMAASFQFMVANLSAIQGHTQRHIIALDWRGFGGTEHSGTDTYWYADYLADLDALLDIIAPQRAVDLLGHSMGGNVAMVYAGIRPSRVRKLINLEGFGLPASHPRQAPTRYARWLDELKTPAILHPYLSVQGVADRLQKNNPRLSDARAAWLAPHWASQGPDGLWQLRADPAHKRTHPLLYNKDEVLACWANITAPTLWVEGDETDFFGNAERGNVWWGDAYPRSEFEARLGVVPMLERAVLNQAGHMLHHDQPEALALCVHQFLS
jgi:pimeloyl-ACP methyl ester carboxylesterase